MSDINKIIIEELRAAEGFVSGQKLCSRLDISRTAVSKHVKALRDLGYEIESVPRRGHRLINPADTPLKMEVDRYLTSKLIGKNYTFTESLASTNSYLASLPLSQCKDGMVAAADSQSAGRGRMNRVWHSPKGRNLYFSILLQPKKEIAEAPQLALIAAVSIVEALRTAAPEIETGIKWPNDILIEGKKLAGVLCEMQAEADTVNKVILGIGLNVNSAVEDFPPELQKISTSLRMQTGRIHHRPELLAELLNSIDRNYALWIRKGLTPFLSFLNEKLLFAGKKISVSSLAGSVHGVVKGIADDGGLILKSEKEERIIHSGEIQIGNH